MRNFDPIDYSNYHTQKITGFYSRKCKFYRKNNFEIINLTTTNNWFLTISNNEESLTQFIKFKKSCATNFSQYNGQKLLVSGAPPWTCFVSQRRNFPECIVKLSSREARWKINTNSAN